MDRYFARTRPDIDPSLIGEAAHQSDTRSEAAAAEAQGDLYFDSGRSALRWALGHLRSESQPLRVGVQTFTCHTVLLAIIESGNTPVLLDIDPEILSTPLAEVRRASIDTLLLTSLAGIAHPEYSEMLTHCRERQIVVLEDLAQSWGAAAPRATMGTLGHASLASFGVDKPVSAYRGGLLRINDPHLLDRLLPHRSSLPEESRAHALGDLARLRAFHCMTSPDRVLRAPNPYLLRGVPMTGRTSPEQAERRLALLLAAPGVARFIRGLLRTIDHRPLRPRRMAPEKVWYLRKMFGNLPQVLDRRRRTARSAIDRLADFGHPLRFPGFDRLPEAATDPAPVRLAALAKTSCDRRVVVEHLRQLGIEAGPFNWPDLAFERIPDLRRRHSRAEFPGSAAAADRIVNMPLWSEDAWRVSAAPPA